MWLLRRSMQRLHHELLLLERLIDLSHRFGILIARSWGI